MKRLAISIIALLFFIQSEIGCTWQVRRVNDPLFIAFNHQTHIYQVFNMDFLYEEIRVKVFVGAMFNIYSDKDGNAIRVEFCNAEYA